MANDIKKTCFYAKVKKYFPEHQALLHISIIFGE